MRNVWKGLVVGSFAGAAVGVALDVIERLGADTQRAAERAKDKSVEFAEQAKDKTVELAEQVKQHAPEVVEAAKDRVSR